MSLPPLTSTLRFIEAGEFYIRTTFIVIPMGGHTDDDDDDLDEQDIPGFSAPSPAVDKGKSREPEQLAKPSAPPTSNQNVSGNIGSNGSSSNSNRQTVGGIRVETR
jgi:hypothetical protein